MVNIYHQAKHIKALVLTLCLCMAISTNTGFCAQQPTATKTEKQKAMPHSDQKKDDVEALSWGDWNQAEKKYGVGIQGSIEQELNQLDKSNLLENANNVKATKVEPKSKNKKIKKTKTLKQMMAELAAMEKKAKQELSDDSEF